MIVKQICVKYIDGSMLNKDVEVDVDEPFSKFKLFIFCTSYGARMTSTNILPNYYWSQTGRQVQNVDVIQDAKASVLVSYKNDTQVIVNANANRWLVIYGVTGVEMI